MSYSYIVSWSKWNVYLQLCAYYRIVASSNMRQNNSGNKILFLRFTWIEQKFTQIVLKSGVQNPAWIFFCISPYYLPRYWKILTRRIWANKFDLPRQRSSVFWTMDFRTICAVVFCSGKVHIFWEGHKFFTKSPNFI